MIHILFTRHGQTDWNKEMKIQGHIDIPLNEEGIHQAEMLHERLLDTKIDLIFSSPLNRAKKTAEIIRGDRDIPLLEDPLLIEEFYGDMEGAPRVDNPDYFRQRTSFFKRYPNGESYFDVYHRVATFFEKIKKEYDGKVDTILVVAHGGMSRVVNVYFKDMENEDFVPYGIHNCEVVEYELK
jgi:broad specificity phosphatase PhoE